MNRILKVKAPSDRSFPMEMQDVLTTVNGAPITVEDVTVFLKVNGTFRNAIYQLIEACVITAKSHELNIQISEREFYEYAETKRRLFGLHNAMDMNRYCKWHGILMDQWNEAMRLELFRKKLKEKIITDANITEFFGEHKNDFVMAYVSRIVCAEQMEICQAKERIVAHQEDFAAVARRISMEKNTRVAGGYLGGIKPGTLPKLIEQEIFAAQPDSVLGPYEQSGYWVLYRVEELSNPALNTTLKQQICDHLFGKWLQKEVLSARV
ncbi:MAG: peptidylprolyl isomerase [Gammaproteobacteria bacterium]